MDRSSLRRDSRRRLPWTFTVTPPRTALSPSSSGLGTNVDWSWDATLAPPGSYSYSIRSDDSVTPAVGTIGGGGAVASHVAGLAADPETVSPNGDTVADETTITYTLTEAANVTVTLRDAAGADAGDDRQQEPGSARASTRSASTRSMLPDGVFQVEVLATGDRRASGDRLDADRRQPNARQAPPPPDSRSHPTRTAWPTGSASASSSRLRRRSGCGSSSRASGWRRRFTGPLELGCAQGRVGRRQAGRPAARRRVRGGRRGDRTRFATSTRRGAVQRGHTRTQGQDPAALPAQALAQRASDRDAPLRHAAAWCTRPSRASARPDAPKQGIVRRSPERATKASLLSSIVAAPRLASGDVQSRRSRPLSTLPSSFASEQQHRPHDEPCLHQPLLALHSARATRLRSGSSPINQSLRPDRHPVSGEIELRILVKKRGRRSGRSTHSASVTLRGWSVWRITCSGPEDARDASQEALPSSA